MNDIVLKGITGLSEEFVAIHDKAQKGDLTSMEALSNLYFDMGDKDKCFLWRDILQTLLRIEIDNGLKMNMFELVPYKGLDPYIEFSTDSYNKSQQRVSKLKEYEKGIINGGKGFYVTDKVDDTVAELIKYNQMNNEKEKIK